MELDPQVVFERLFGSGATPEVRMARMRQSRSILDSVLAELPGLKKDLGAADQRTVDQYTDEIREIERRIQIAAGVTRQSAGRWTSRRAFRSSSTTTSSCTGI